MCIISWNVRTYAPSYDVFQIIRIMSRIDAHSIQESTCVRDQTGLVRGTLRLMDPDRNITQALAWHCGGRSAVSRLLSSTILSKHNSFGSLATAEQINVFARYRPRLWCAFVNGPEGQIYICHARRRVSTVVPNPLTSVANFTLFSGSPTPHPAGLDLHASRKAPLNLFACLPSPCISLSRPFLTTGTHDATPT